LDVLILAEWLKTLRSEVQVRPIAPGSPPQPPQSIAGLSERSFVGKVGESPGSDLGNHH
jgi:hypothetical protein